MLAQSSLDKVLRRSVDDNAWDEESDEVWRGMARSSRHFVLHFVAHLIVYASSYTSPVLPARRLETGPASGVVQVSGEAKEFVSTTKSTKGTKVPLFVGRLRIPRATGMPFGTRTGYGSYLPRKNTKAGTDAAENTHNSQLSSWSSCLACKFFHKSLEAKRLSCACSLSISFVAQKQMACVGKP